MTSDLLKPLRVFCTQTQSQRYIKTIKNLGDSWRRLGEKPPPESDEASVWVETSFDLVLKITNPLKDDKRPNPMNVEMSTHAPSTTSPSAKSAMPEETPRHYRIFADYGTDFIWRDPNDLRPEEGDCMLEAEEALSTFPPSLLELYTSWVDTYSDNFTERRDKTQNYHANIFLTTSEEVAWNVAGFLLAWRIALAPQVGRIEFSAGCSQYFLEKGQETDVTLKFLQDQVDILTSGKPVS